MKPQLILLCILCSPVGLFSQIQTRNFIVDYAVINLEKCLKTYPVNDAGILSAQSGVNYYWTLSSDTAVWNCTGVFSEFCFPESSKMAAKYKLCMKAVVAGDTSLFVINCKDLFLNDDLLSERNNKTGYFFYEDLNSNCKCDTTERLLSIDAELINSENRYFIQKKHKSGNETIHLSPGSYNVISKTSWAAIAECSGFKIVSDSAYENSFQGIPVKITKSGYDFSVNMRQVNGWNPGYTGDLRLEIQNRGSTRGTAHLKLNKPDSLIYFTSDKSPIKNSPSFLEWKIELNSGEIQYINAKFKISENQYSHTDEVALMLISDTLNKDLDSTDNRYSAVIQLNGSYDPNDKQVNSPDALNHLYPLEYLIRFQNTGTAPARMVVIKDSLPEEVNTESVSIINTSHPCTVILMNGKLIFRFENIMLPDSGSDLNGSQGFVRFKTRLKPNKVGEEYDTVRNRAAIFFDYNEPVVTNDAIIFASLKAGISNIEHNRFLVYPNPVFGNKITVIYSRTDRNSGIELYEPDGKLVWRIKMPDDSDSITFNLPDNIRNGVYILKTGTLFTRVLVSK